MDFEIAGLMGLVLYDRDWVQVGKVAVAERWWRLSWPGLTEILKIKNN
jgi:hypothetical protein